MTKKCHPITVGDLLNALKIHNPNAELYFGGLDYYRVKRRGPDTVQIEFNQSVYLDENDQVVIENFYSDNESDVR